MNGNHTITVTGINVPAGLTNGDSVTFAGIPTVGGLTTGQLDNTPLVVSGVTTGAGGSFTITVGGAAAGSSGFVTGTSSTTAFDLSGDTTSTATVTSRLFSGDVLDASSPTSSLITSPSSYSTAALSFTITTPTTGTSTFTYTAAAPNTALGQFSTLDNLASAISAVNGLTARVVNGKLYVAAVNGDDSITFANGSVTGTNTSPPLAGIDWVRELGIGNVSTATGRFSTMQGLANLVNNNSRVLPPPSIIR